MMWSSLRAILLGIVVFSVATSAAARDTTYHLPMAEALNSSEAKQALDGSVKFYLAGQDTPPILQRFDDDISNRKTNGLGKSDQEGCRWVLLSVLQAFQEKAKKAGANAVVDMVSYYKKHEVKNATTYECHAGSVVIGVAYKGTYAKVAPN